MGVDCLRGVGLAFAALTGLFALPALLLPEQAVLEPDKEFLIGTPAIRYALAKLNVLGSVLMIGAHPDDENNALLAYLSRGLKARTGYLACTRGEGGQNLLGVEQGSLLGVLRTQELLAARRDDGGAQFFTRAIDFGFTTSPQETLADWGHDRTLSDIVWVIRQQQPDVIILSFSGTPSDGHGHHQASAILGKEAYEAAGDPSRFPEQLKYVQPWRARRLMRSRFAPLAGDAEQAPGPGRSPDPDPFPNQPVITVESGAYDPVIGRSYREIGGISRNEHRSQGQGAPLVYGAGRNLIAFVQGEMPSRGIFDGIDTSWTRVPGAARAGELLAKAQRDFDDQHPEKTVAALMEARAEIVPLARAGQTWAEWKLSGIDEAIALCAGIRAEAQADAFAYAPGSTAKISLTALNRSPLPVQLAGVHLSGWADSDATVKNRTLAPNTPEVLTVSLPISTSQRYSQPYWLREPHAPGSYNIPDQNLIGRAENSAEVIARFDFTLNAAPFSLTRPLHYRAADPSRGEYIRPVGVEPPFAIDLPAANFVYPTGTPRDFTLQIRALSANQSGEVHLDMPRGWKATPASVPFHLREAGIAQEVRFHLTPPAEASTGRFKVVAKAASVGIATGVDVISYSHIPAQTVLTPAEGNLSAAPIQVLAKRVGYVMGSSDREPEALRQMGCRVDLLDEKDLGSGDLSVYDAIVTGVRAYSVRPDLRAAQQRLLDYTKNGGTLVVQYNNSADARISPSVAVALDHLGPYPFTFGRDDARVTDETAPVRILAPASPLLNVPNKITAADFEGWVQERGLYFSKTWDAKYETPIETHDAGKPDLPGGMLYTRYGKGVYIFSAYSWFRELPAGVPGAYRIFANLISAGKAVNGRAAAGSR
ncbi:MAG: PIG-L family deacetylase [Acidobacteriota bacterium]|nr:PIG-L family deacetylase [Acidobacteriota bacterium]